MPLSKRVSSLLDSLSLEQKAGQIFVFTFLSERQALNELRFHPGGYVRIYGDVLTAARQNQKLQQATEIPLILSADFERGIGSTVTGATDFVTMMCLGASANPEHAYNCAAGIAQEALAMGINTNYVPVLDVNVNEANPIINVRSFGHDPELVAVMGEAFIRGTQETGVIACGKHFPGHGDTAIDSHTNLGTIEASKDRMNQVELVPFRRAIAAGVDSIMSAHLQINAYDDSGLPATLSRKIMHRLLREELGFEGLAVSDALDMGGITRNFTPEDAIIKAINAGIDTLIMPMNPGRAVNTVINAVRDGLISEERLNEAVGRVLSTKEKRGILDRKPVNPADVPAQTCVPKNRAVALNAALDGITLIKNVDATLPVTTGKRVAVITFTNHEDGRSYYLDPNTFPAHLAATGVSVEHVHCGLLDDRAVHEFNCVDRSLAAAEQTDVVIVAAYTKVVINRGTVSLPDHYASFVNRLAAKNARLALISFGNPYLIKQFPNVGAFACGYGATDPTQEAMAQIVAGQKPFKGTLPVTISV